MINGYKKISELKTKRWCKEESMWLEIMYPHIPNSILSERFGASPGALDMKASKLGLKKTEAAKREALSMGKKIYDLNNGFDPNNRIKSYPLAYAPEHPKANKGYVREHIIIMEKKLGRYLYDWEKVFHKDGNLANNEPENLYVKEFISAELVDEHELIMKRKHGVPIDTLLKQYKLTSRVLYKILEKHGCIDEKKRRKKKKDD